MKFYVFFLLFLCLSSCVLAQPKEEKKSKKGPGPGPGPTAAPVSSTSQVAGPPPPTPKPTASSSSSTTSTAAKSSAEKPTTQGVTEIQQTTPGSTEVIYVVQGTIRINADYFAVSNLTLYQFQLENALSDYFSHNSQVNSLRNGSIIADFLVFTPASDLQNTLEKLARLLNSTSFGEYTLLPNVDASKDPVIGQVSPSGSSKNVGAIVGGVLAGVFILSAGILAFVIFRNKRKAKQEKERDLEKTVESKAQPKPTDKIFLDNIEIKGKIAEGKFGDVYRGVWNQTTEVALKSVKHLGDERAFVNEVELLTKLNHPNVIRALGIYKDEAGKSYLVMEFLSKGSLCNYLQQPHMESELTSLDLVNMSLHLAAGMKYLEQKKVIHRDLATRNLLVTLVDGHYNIKIADFGLSRETQAAEYHTHGSVMPIRWSAPESFQSHSFSHQSDAWSFAVTLWEIFEFGKEPYSGMSNIEVMRAVTTENFRLPRPIKCPLAVYQLMIRCWDSDRTKRPSFGAICKEITEIAKEIEESEDNQSVCSKWSPPLSLESDREDGDEFVIVQAADDTYVRTK